MPLDRACPHVQFTAFNGLLSVVSGPSCLSVSPAWSLWVFVVRGLCSSALVHNLRIGKSTIQRPGWCITGSKNVLGVLDSAPAQAAGGSPVAQLTCIFLSPTLLIHPLLNPHTFHSPFAPLCTITGRTHFEWIR